MMNENILSKITVTSPFLPPLEEYISYLDKIWKNKWLTNKGEFHEELEQALCDFLGVPYISLFNNGTIALMVALRALRITGEVITTPFTFVATTHALQWNRITPVFVDIDHETCNLAPGKIEAAISPQTAAILPVHVYGNPCNVAEINQIADTYGLKVLYDAAHAFGVKINGDTILNYGNLSVLSFHATKVFHTFEGGAIVCHDEKIKKHIDYLKNFGYKNEVTVVREGINGKMNEAQAAMGMAQLKYIDQGIQKRKEIANYYNNKIRGISGVTILNIPNNVESNYGYYPIFINEKEYGKNRDELYAVFRQNGIFVRRYFYPLVSEFPVYNNLSSASRANLSTAIEVSNQVLCLPIYADLENEKVKRVIEIVEKTKG